MQTKGTIFWYGSRFLQAIAFVFLVSLVGGMLLSFVPVNTSFAQTEQDSVEIYITSNGIHTDLVLPVKTAHIDWREKLPLAHFPGADSTYANIAFGWGDRRFYMETPEWSDLTLEVALSAALWPTPTAMHVEYVPEKLTPTRQQRPIKLSEEQYVKLVEYIQDSFQQKGGNFILIPGAGYTPEDNFYEGTGKFYFPKNCNNWVNSGLKAAGVKTALWAPFPFAVMRHFR